MYTGAFFWAYRLCTREKIKMARIKNMTEGSPGRLIFLFAIPLMIGNIFQQLYIMVDTMVVGQGVGVKALASLGAADWLNWMFLGMMTGITQGFSILFAQFYGAGDKSSLKKAVGNAVVLSVGFGALLLIVGEGGLRLFLRILDTPADIIGGSELYLRVAFAGIPVILGYNLLAAMLRALGDGRTPLYAMVAAAVVNVALDLLFVMVFHWGIAGAAFATVIAQGFSMLVCLRAVRKLEWLHPGKADLRPDLSMMKRLVVLGIPIMFQNCVIAVGGMVVQNVVNGFGFIFVAGFTATNKLYGLLETASISFGFSMTTFAGQNMGAGLYSRIRRGTRTAAVMAVLTSVIISAAMLAFGKPILGLFVSGDAGQKAEVLAVAYRYLAVMSVTLAALYLLHLLRGALQGLGNAMLPMAAGIMEFVMRVCAALLLPKFMGSDGIFYAESLAWFGALAVLIPSYFITMRKLSGRELKQNE